MRYLKGDKMNNADIAHLEEHLPCKEDVDGSKPSVGSNCGSSLMVELQSSKLRMRARFPSSAPIKTKVCNFCHGSGLAQVKGKRGAIDIVYCPECFGNGYKGVE